MPTGVAPHKRIDPEPGAAVRLELTRAAAQGDATLEVSDFEVRRKAPSFTYLTLEALRDLRPGAELFFLLGADMAAGIESWERPSRVLELARLGVAARPGTSIEQVTAAFGRLGAADRLEVVQMPEVDVSSTQVRERAGRGDSLTGLVPGPVATAIAERGLYRQAVRA